VLTGPDTDDDALPVASSVALPVLDGLIESGALAARRPRAGEGGRREGQRQRGEGRAPRQEAAAQLGVHDEPQQHGRCQQSSALSNG